MNLELVETIALLDELMSRFKHAVFAGMKVRPNPTIKQPDDCDISELKHYKGEHRTCQGMAYSILAHVERERMKISDYTKDSDW